MGSAGCRRAAEDKAPVVGRAVLALERRAALLLPKKLVAAAGRGVEERRRSPAGRR